MFMSHLIGRGKEEDLISFSLSLSLRAAMFPLSVHLHVPAASPRHRAQSAVHEMLTVYCYIIQ